MLTGKLEQNQSNQVGFGERVAVSCGDVAGVAISVTVSSFLLNFYTDSLMLNAAVIGAILFASKFIGAVFDILMGHAIDRTKSRFGKCRPWILRICVPYAVSGVLLFSVPESSLPIKYVYIFLAYNLVNVCISALNNSMGALNARITRNQYGRSIVNIFRMTASLIASVAINNVTLPLVARFGGGQKGWQLTFAVYGVISVVLLLVTFIFTRERVEQGKKAEKRKHLSSLYEFKALFKNRYWVILFFFSFMAAVLQPVSGGIKIYYAKYVLGDKALIGLLSLFNTVPTIIAMFFIAPLIKRIGKRASVMAGLAISAMGLLIMLANPSNLRFVLTGYVLRGIGNAPITGTSFAMLADTVEYGQWKTGMRNEGLIYGVSSSAKKIGSGIGTGLLGILLAAGGFSGKTHVITQSTVFTIKSAAIILPLVLIAVQMLLLSRYKLDNEYPDIVKELEHG